MPLSRPSIEFCQNTICCLNLRNLLFFEQKFCSKGSKATFLSHQPSRFFHPFIPQVIRVFAAPVTFVLRAQQSLQPCEISVIARQFMNGKNGWHEGCCAVGAFR